MRAKSADRPLHVAVAAHDFYPDPGSGGTGRYVYETVRRMVERGHRISVVTRRRGDVPDAERIDGVDVYRYDLSIDGASAPAVLGQLPGAARTVGGHARSFSAADAPDVVSFQGPITSLLLDAALPLAPRITTFHSPWPTEYAIKRRTDGAVSPARRRLNVALRRWLEGLVLRRCDGVITLSEYMREQLRDVHGPLRNGRGRLRDGRGWLRDGHDDDLDVSVVPGGVDADRFFPDAGDFDRIGRDELAFLTVRRLSARMGHDELLRAFASVHGSILNAHLYIAGDGPLRGRLEREASRLGVEDATTFLGYVPDEDLPAAYAAADVFVLPTQDLEGFGLATLEALASGTPVVATPVGGTVEVLAGLDDRLPADPLTADASADAIADGMVEWAEIGEEARDAAGSTCRSFVEERYTWEQAVERLLEEYRRHVGPGRERGDAPRLTQRGG